MIRVLGLVWVLFFRFLLTCQLEGLDLAFVLKGFLSTSEHYLRTGPRGQVCSVLRLGIKKFEFQRFS